MTSTEFDTFLRKEMRDAYFMQSTITKQIDGPDMGTHAGCIEFCKDKYTNADGSKIKGRGTCKANCWIDTVIRILDAIMPL